MKGHFWIFWIMLSAMMLSGCGGKGASTSTQPGITLTLSPNTVTSTTPSSLSIQTNDASGRAISMAVTLSAQNNKVTLSRTTVTTDSTGKATVLANYLEKGSEVIQATGSLNNVDYAKNLSFTVGDNTTSAGGNASYTLTLNVANNINTLSKSAPLEMTVNLVDKDSVPIKNAMIQLNSTLATFSAGNGQVFTDANGNANVTLLAGDTTGADFVTASYLDATTVGAGSPVVLATTKFPVTVVATSVSATHPILMTPVSVGLSNLSYGGTTSVSVQLYNDLDDSGSYNSSVDTLYTNSLPVTFNSSCVGAGKSTIDTPVQTLGGQATATYQAVTCENIDTVTASASIGDKTLTQSSNLTVAQATLGAIQYVSVAPEAIYIKGSGGVNTSTVTFKVTNQYGFPFANAKVAFSLNTTVGGIILVQADGLTNANGEVSAQINSGTVATPVRVIAEVLDAAGSPTGVRTESAGLVISTGIADQQHFSLSADVSNPEAWNYFGEVVNLTASLSDANGNPVMDGTQVQFKTESGQVLPSCLTAKGSCSVTWTSQNELNRPIDHRATILAYALGNEFFHDSNGDGLYSATDGEPWDNKSSSGLKSIFTINGSQGRKLVTLNEVYDEPFVDTNGNGLFDEPFSPDASGNYVFGAQFIDYNHNGKYDGAGNNAAGETSFFDMNAALNGSGNGAYSGSGEAFPEMYTDLNLNGAHDAGEPFIDRQDILGHVDGQYDNGSVTIGGTVYKGAEDYTDTNSNGKFDGPGFSDLSEPWLDKDENGVRTSDEPFVDFNHDGLFTPRNGKYDGFSCSGDATVCGDSSTYVRRAIVLVMASSNPNYVVKLSNAVGTCAAGDILKTNDGSTATSCSLNIPNGATANLSIYIADTSDQVMPNGTTVSVAASAGTLEGTINYTFPNSNQNSGHTMGVTIKDADNTTNVATAGSLDIVVTSPKGVVNTISIPYISN